MMKPVLYIHPDQKVLRPEVIPMGLVGLLNEISPFVEGRFWYEVKAEEIKAAKVIVMDLHWYYGLLSFITLVNCIRKNNPQVPIITGGYTASVFAPFILKNNLADFIVVADAEVPFPALIDALLNGGDYSKIPNIITGEQTVPSSRYLCSTADLDRMNYLDFNFFKGIKKTLRKLHQAKVHVETHPYLVVFRGCGHNCDHCISASTPYKLWTGQTQVIRSPQRVREDLLELAQRGANFVSIFHDFISHLSEDYTREILKTRFSIRVRYEYCMPPKPELFKLLLNSFTGGHIVISLPDYMMGDMSYLHEISSIWKQHPNFKLSFFINEKALKPEHRVDLFKLFKLWSQNFFYINTNADWFHIPVLKDGPYFSEAKFNQFVKMASKVPLRDWLARLYHRSLTPWLWSYQENLLRHGQSIFLLHRAWTGTIK